MKKILKIIFYSLGFLFLIMAAFYTFLGYDYRFAYTPDSVIECIGGAICLIFFTAGFFLEKKRGRMILLFLPVLLYALFLVLRALLLIVLLSLSWGRGGFAP